VYQADLHPLLFGGFPSVIEKSSSVTHPSGRCLTAETIPSFLYAAWLRDTRPPPRPFGLRPAGPQQNRACYFVTDPKGHLPRATASACSARSDLNPGSLAHSQTKNLHCRHRNLLRSIDQA